MPPKRKPRQAAKVEDPQTPEEYLAVADDFEQAGGKWRQGDAAKASRFFRRAIDCYEKGLSKFPNDPDLAYNKANLQYEICQDSNILAEFGDRMPLLEETLESHRYALRLDPSNTDAQFNTSQTLTLLAEAVVDTDSAQETGYAKGRALTLLQEAIALFEKCLEAQQEQYEKNTSALAASKSQDEEGRDEESQDEENQHEEDMEVDQIGQTLSRTSSPREEWVLIEEPLTPNTILVTCTAELEALETLLGLNDPLDGPLDNTIMNTLAENGRTIVDTVLPRLFALLHQSPFQEAEDESTGPMLSISSPGNEKKAETTPKETVILAKAKFTVAVVDYMYRGGDRNTSQYTKVIEEQFKPLAQRPESKHAFPAYLDALAAYADALLAFASTVQDVLKNTRVAIPPDSEAPASADIHRIQWKALSQAQDLYKRYCAGEPGLMPNASALMDTYMARGNAELLRVRLGDLPNAETSWSGSRKTLIKNAGVYYRGAYKWAETAGDIATRAEAGVRDIIAEVLRKILTAEPIKNDEKLHWDSYIGHVMPSVRTMYEDGYLSRNMVNQLISFLSLDRQQILGDD